MLKVFDPNSDYVCDNCRKLADLSVSGAPLGTTHVTDETIEEGIVPFFMSVLRWIARTFWLESRTENRLSPDVICV